MTTIVILGSTGSIGRAVVEIVEKFPDEFMIIGMAAGRNVDEFAGQLRRFPLARFTLRDTDSHGRLLELDSSFVKRSYGYGSEGIERLIAECSPDLVVNALVGISGLVPTITALKHGCRVALANKEALVTGGELISSMLPDDAENPIIPVDSEHFSISRCLKGHEGRVREIILTASGGPFYGRAFSGLEHVTAEEVLDHPTWKMGRKVTVDSAHMLNKGLEVIEAHWLFGFPYESIQVVVHPQSIVHAFVRFEDGSLLAHLGPADMKLPIMNALSYPEIRQFPWKSIGLEDLGRLDFHPLRSGEFPAFHLALEAAVAGGTVPTVLNAADEVAVDAFLKGRIGFLDIVRWIEEAVGKHVPGPVRTIGDVLDADRWAREFLKERHGEAIT